MANLDVNFANREVAKVIFVNYTTKVPYMFMDYANATTTNLTGTTVYAYGGQGRPKRVAFNGERGGTLEIDTQMQSSKLYALLSGAEIEKSATFLKRLVLPATAKVITLPTTPATGSTVNVFAIGDDCGTPIANTVADKTITLTTGTDAEYIVYYMEEITTGVAKINIKNTTFPKCFTIYMYTTDKNENDELVGKRITAYKAQPQAGFSITNSNTGDPATVKITFDLLIDGDKNLLDIAETDTID